MSRLLKTRSRKIIATVTALSLAAGTAVLVLALTGKSSSANASETVIYSPVAARTLQSTTVISGTLGHKNVTTIKAQSPGYLSAINAVDNQTANAGSTLFALNGRNAIAENGSLPFFRSLAPGDVGADVVELKQILAAAGDNPGDTSDVFTQQTQAALAQWQTQHGYPSATPASSEAVMVALQQGSGYDVGTRSSVGLTIGPPGTSAPASGAPATPSNANVPSAPPAPASHESSSQDSAVPHILTRSSGRPHTRVSDHRHRAALAHVGAPPQQMFLSGNFTVTAGGTATVVVYANAPSNQNTDVYLTLGGNAQAGVDYNPVNPVVMLPAGTTSVAFNITTLVPQTIPSTTKFIDVALSQSPSGSYVVSEPSAATVTINEASGNAALPSVTLTGSTNYLTKGTPFTVVIDLSQAITTTLTIGLGYAGSAVAGTDFLTPPSGSLVAQPGQTQLAVNIPTIANDQVEGDRVLTVSLAAGAGYQVGSPASASVTIHDPNVPKVTITGGTTVEAGSSVTMTITTNQSVVQDTQVAVTLAGSAVAGTDFTPPNPVVTIAAGQTTATLTVQTLINQVVAPDRYIIVSVAQSASGTYTVGSPGSTVITLPGVQPASSPPIATLSSGITYLHKGSPFPVTIGLSESLAVPVTIQLAFGGTAVQGVDFTPPPGVLQIPPGQTSLPITIPTVADNVVQSDRTLVVSLVSNPLYQVGAPNSVSVDITSLVVPTLTISASTSSLTEGGTATFTVTADQAPVKDTSVNFAIAGTAQPGQDYVPLAGTVILPAGQTQVTVNFQSIQKDVVFESTDMIVGQWPIRIGQVYVKQGDTITAGSPILDLTEPNVTVTLQASPSDFTKLALGQSCKMTISGGQTEYHGTISQLDTNPTLQSSGSSSSSGGGASQVFQGRIEVTDLSAGDVAADGATVSITVVTKQVTDAMTVPIAAVEQNGTGNDVVRVVTVGKNGGITAVPVTTGLTEGSYVQVTGDLHLGETVVVTVDKNQA